MEKGWVKWDKIRRGGGIWIEVGPIYSGLRLRWRKVVE
jgi:hypothetical protein